MEGVMILDSYSAITGFQPGINFLSIIGFIILVIGFCVVKVLSQAGADSMKIGIACLVCSVGTVMALIGITFATPLRETRYQVLIENDVSVVKFYDKYDIISQRGQTFIVREKKEE